VDRRPNRFPNGLRAISDYAHGKDVDIIVWFEPERVAGGTWLTEHHPEWILGGKDGGLLNLGNPDAWHWVVTHIDKLIKEEGIDLYRQDFNIDPLGYWQKNDTQDRQGITENKYVSGYLAYWDELKKRNPGMLIDSCASGGRRNDLETMRRAVPRCEAITFLSRSVSRPTPMHFHPGCLFMAQVIIRQTHRAGAMAPEVPLHTALMSAAVICVRPISVFSISELKWMMH
jgi:hypothetical protein